MNTLDFKKKKLGGIKISMVTCYDTWSAKILATTPIDCLLVGDSSAMVMHGHTSTLPATVETLALHTAAVVRGASGKFIVADMPFLAHRKGLSEGVAAVQTLMQAGASAVKIEGGQAHVDFIRHIVDSGVPVMGHLGLTPQSIHQLGGFKVQGKEPAQFEQIFKDAQALQQAGCFALVLECVPNGLAQRISRALEIPTIGIGAGIETDGQVLVLQDMLGMNADFKPKFLRKYLQGFELIQNAVTEYHKDVVDKKFPAIEESYEG